MPACGQAVGCGVCDTPELWRGAAGLCTRVRACAGAAESLHIYIAPPRLRLLPECERCDYELCSPTKTGTIIVICSRPSGQTYGSQAGRSEVGLYTILLLPIL